MKARTGAFLQRHRAVIAPLAVAAILRFALLLVAYLRTGTRVMTQGDTASYLLPGHNLFLKWNYANAVGPEIDRTPGYPVFLMLAGMLHGHVLIAASVQIVLSLVSLLLVRDIARIVFGSEDAGKYAAWLYAVEPASIVYAVRLMPETLFVLLMLAMLRALLEHLATARVCWLVICGAVLAAATYVRPVCYYLSFALALALACTARRGTGNWWKGPGVLLLTVLPVLALWQIRNHRETGYGGFSSIVEKNLYFYQAAGVTAELDHVSLEDEQSRLGYPDEASYVAVHPEQRNWSQVERLKYMRSQAADVLKSHWLLYLKSHFTGVVVVAFTPCAAELMQLLGLYPEDSTMPRRVVNEGVVNSLERLRESHPAYIAVMICLEMFLFVVYVFSLVGVIAGKGNRLALAAIIGLAAYFLLISGGAQAVGRYRLPVMPELCILAAGGWVSRRGARQRKERSLDGPALETR